MIRKKNTEQIDGIRSSCRLLADLFTILEGEILPGISPAYLDGLARSYIEDLGATPAFLGYGGFPGTLCTSVNSQVIHGIPNKTVLRDGDVISIDCGIISQGFTVIALIPFPLA